MARSNPLCAALAARRARAPPVQRPAGLHLAVLGEQPDLGADLELRGRAIPRDDRLRRRRRRGSTRTWTTWWARWSAAAPKPGRPSEMGARYETLQAHDRPVRGEGRRAARRSSSWARTNATPYSARSRRRSERPARTRCSPGCGNSTRAAERGRQWCGSVGFAPGIEARYCVGAWPKARRNIAVNALGLL